MIFGRIWAPNTMIHQNTFYFYKLSVLIEHFVADFVTPVLKLLTDFNDESQEVEEDMITQSALRAFYDDEEVME